MASSELVECGVCSEYFNEEGHKPILLPCSHSFCMHCVDIFIQYESKQCPICRKKFQASSSEDFPTNRGLLDVVKYFRQLESRHSEYGMTYEGWRDSHKENVANTKTIIEKAEKFIQMDESLVDVVQNINGELKVIVEDNENFVEKMRKHKDKLRKHLKGIEEEVKLVNEAQIKLEEAVNFKTAGPFIDEVSHSMKVIQGTIVEMKLALGANHELFENVKKKCKGSQRKVDCILELIDSTEGEKDDASLNCSSAAGSTAKGGKGLIFLTVEEFWEAKGDVYAVKTVNGVRRYSRVIRTGEDNKMLCIPSLKEEQNIPPNAQFVRYEYLKSLDSYGSPPRAFMDLSLWGKSLGRIIVTYINEYFYKDHINNHQCLCSGELGPSFVDSNVLELKNITKGDEMLIFGDYERNDGTGGKAVCGSPWGEQEIDTRYMQSPMYGICPHTSKEETASQFCVMTRGSLKKCFGQITEGIAILQTSVQKYENIEEIKISECGVVVNYKGKEGE